MHTKQQELQHVKQLFPLQISITFPAKTHLELIRGEDFLENGTGNALSDSRSHTLNGNLNKKPPHRCSLSLSLARCGSHVWNLSIDVQWKVYIAEAYLRAGH